MMVHLMLYQDEILENENRFTKVEIRPKEIQLAQQLIENLTDKFQPEKFKDEYQERVEELIESKISGKKLRIVKAKPKQKVADLMEALQRSVQQTSKSRTAKPAARARKKAS
jgi:DNA end-binding protein Ku